MLRTLAPVIQLSFQPALDPFHALYRILRLFLIVERHKGLHRDQVRILDYYLLNPHRVSEIRLAPKHRKYKSLAKRYASAKPYGQQPDDRILFGRMEPMQTAALQTLAVYGLLDSNELELARVVSTGAPVPGALRERVAVANEEDASLMEFLEILVSEYELSGVNGLKDRTGLLEHRYDTV